MENSTSILDKFKQNKIFKVVSGYAIVAFITVQIASLVSDSFGLGQEFMQNVIIVFLLILPFIALVAWAASSRYSTTKILGITLAVLFTGYGTGSGTHIIGIALNLDDNKIAWSYDGTWQGSTDPSSGNTNMISITDPSSLNSGVYFPTFSQKDNSRVFNINFGNGFFGTTAITSAGSNGNGSLFEYDCPSGYYALNTKNINTYG